MKQYKVPISLGGERGKYIEKICGGVIDHFVEAGLTHKEVLVSLVFLLQSFLESGKGVEKAEVILQITEGPTP